MLDVRAIRSQFPALNQDYNGRPGIFFDNPGGTQVPQRVIDAMVDYLVRCNANLHGAFETSRRTDQVVADAHQAAADLLGCEADEVVFGPNMTTLTFQISRSLAQELHRGSEVVVTRLDHDANIMPWVLAARERGAAVRWVDVDVETGTLDMADFQAKITPRTKLVAVGYASNATGTINDVATVIRWAKAVGAYTFVDAVQYAPHLPVDVRALDCDFLVCSAYKFFGPHVGVLYGRRALLERLSAYKVRPADDRPPGKWETGTQNHEGMAGVLAAIDYLADLGATYGAARPEDDRRTRLLAAWQVIQDYEQRLLGRLLTGLQAIPGVRIYGLTDPKDWPRRVATVSLRKSGTVPAQLAQALAQENIFAWHGNFYALEFSQRVGAEDSGGFLRLGLVHYNTAAEIDRCLEVLEAV